jgi:murein peptide amidase A
MGPWPRLLVVLAIVAGVSASSASAAPTSTLRHELVGYSVEHRPIVAWLVGSPDAPRTMVVFGSIAGDEPGGSGVARLLAAQRPIPGVAMWLIPNVNPDGAVRGTRQNAHGVDLNRNFPWHWRRLGGRNYSGRRPGSERETKAVEAFLRRTRPRLAVWLHQPYGLIDDSQGPRWAERLLGRELGLPLKHLPDYPGSAIGWEDHLLHASAFDVELGSTGRLGPAETHVVADAIRSLARRYAAR